MDRTKVRTPLYNCQPPFKPPSQDIITWFPCTNGMSRLDLAVTNVPRHAGMHALMEPGRGRIASPLQPLASVITQLAHLACGIEHLRPQHAIDALHR